MGPVLVLGNPQKPEVATAFAAVRDKLEQMFGIAAADLKGTLDLQEGPAAAAQWAIVFGGDGMILAASRRMGAKTLPTLAVNFGRLGYLTEVEFEQLEEALDRIAAGRHQIRERMRLIAQVGEWQSHALNDVVVTAARSGRLFRVSAKIDGREAMRYAGDGVVIATPTGSTAYSLAAGGPILDPHLKAAVLTPLCAHALGQRPIVISEDHKIELYLRDGDPDGRVVVDGQESHEISGTDRLRVRKAKTPFPMIRVSSRSYYQRLRRMLG